MHVEPYKLTVIIVIIIIIINIIIKGSCQVKDECPSKIGDHSKQAAHMGANKFGLKTTDVLLKHQQEFLKY